MYQYSIVFLFIIIIIVFYYNDYIITNILKKRFIDFWNINRRFKKGIVYFNFIKQIEHEKEIFSVLRKRILVQKLIFAFFSFLVIIIVSYWFYLLLNNIWFNLYTVYLGQIIFCDVKFHKSTEFISKIYFLSIYYNKRGWTIFQTQAWKSSKFNGHWVLRMYRNDFLNQFKRLLSN